MAENLLRPTRVRVVSGTVAPVYERPGYRTLLGRIRTNVRTYIRKQLELPRQEIAEIIEANKRAAMWLAVSAMLALALLVTLVVLLIALVALIPREWLAIFVLALAIGTGIAVLVAAMRGRALLAGILGAMLLIAIGVLAYLFLPQLVLAALLFAIALGAGTGATGYGGYKRLELRGPSRSINSVKETIRWARSRLLGRTAS